MVAGFSWQLIAGWVTGDAGAYLATELAWRRNWVAGRGGLPAARGLPQRHRVLVRVDVGAEPRRSATSCSRRGVVAIAAVLLFEPHVRRLGVELRLWSASYLVYLLLVFFPQSSIFRLLAAAVAAVGSVRAAALDGVARRRARRRPRRPVVVDLQHVRAGEYHLAGSLTPSRAIRRSLSTGGRAGLSAVLRAR